MLPSPVPPQPGAASPSLAAKRSMAPESTPKVSRDHPVVISKYITGAKEVEMDGIGKATETRGICWRVWW